MQRVKSRASHKWAGWRNKHGSQWTSDHLANEKYEWNPWSSPYRGRQGRMRSITNMFGQYDAQRAAVRTPMRHKRLAYIWREYRSILCSFVSITPAWPYVHPDLYVQLIKPAKSAVQSRPPCKTTQSQKEVEWHFIIEPNAPAPGKQPVQPTSKYDEPKNVCPSRATRTARGDSASKQCRSLIHCKPAIKCTKIFWQKTWNWVAKARLGILW